MNKSKNIVIAGLLLMELLAAIDTTGVTVMVPTLQAYFKIPPEVAGWILMAYLIPFSIFLVPMGYLADRCNAPEKMITWCILTFAVCSAVCGLAPNEQLLIAFRIIKGIAAAGMFACEFAIILKYWAEPRRTVEIVVIGIAVGVLAGPICGALFAKTNLWRYFFIIGASLAILGFTCFQWIKKLEPVTREADQEENQSQTFKAKAKELLGLLFWGMLLDFIFSLATQGANLLITLQVQETLGKSAMFNGLILLAISLAMVIATGAKVGSLLFPKLDTAVWASGLMIGISIFCLAAFTNWINIPAFACYAALGLALGIIFSTLELMVLTPLPTSLLAQGNGWIVSSMQAGYGAASFLIPLLYLKLGLNVSAYLMAGLVFAVIPIFLVFRKK